MNHVRRIAWILLLAVGFPTHAGPPAPLAAPPAVRRNQSILLVALANGIRLSAPGRALKDGQAGEIIPVLNTATRFSLKGIVRDGWIEIPSTNEPKP